MQIKFTDKIMLATIILFFTSLYASHDDQFKEIDGIAIYLAVLPAEMLRGHPKEHSVSTMHSEQRLEGKNQHHIMVSLFDGKTGTRVQGAIVKARVLGKDFNGLMKPLELMIMGGTQSYGNYFNVPRQGAYRIEVEIQPPGKGKVVKVAFQYGSA
jgi:hypothetical protein